MSVPSIVDWLLPLVQRKYLPMLLVGLFTFSTGLSFRVWQGRSRDGRAALNRDLQALLGTRSEARRDEQEAGALALALASNAVDVGFSCEVADHEVCADARRLLRDALKPSGSLALEVSRCAGQDAYEHAFATHAHCAEVDRNAHIYVPSNSPLLRAELDRARQVAAALARAAIRERFTQPSEPLLTSLYYVTSDGYFAERSLFPETAADHPDASVRWAQPLGTLYATDGPGARVRMEAGGGYQLRDRSYVEYFRREIREGRAPTSYHSEPYLDLAGGGVVRTFCIYDGDGRNNGEGSRYFGVVCADYALPLRLQERPRYEGVLDVGVAVNRHGRVELASGEPSAVVSEGLERLAQRRGTLEPHLVVRGQGGQKLALVKIRRYRGATWWLILGAAPPEIDWWLTVFIASAVFFSLATIAIVVLRTLRDKEEVELAMLRNLQVGVVQVRGDRVVGGNDRAEELLGRPLPSLDDPRAGPRFQDLYGELLEKTTEGGRVAFRSIEEAEIDRRRGLGESFSYLAKLKLERVPSRWLEVWGTPFLDNTDVADSKRRTFAVLRPTHRPWSTARSAIQWSDPIGRVKVWQDSPTTNDVGRASDDEPPREES